MLAFTKLFAFTSRTALATVRFSAVTAVLSTLAVQTLARPTSHVDHVVHEKRDNIQLKWIQGNALDSDYVIPARIGLKQNNLDLGALYLSEV
jgi:tripeptidyl-peptidase-1